MLPQNQFLASSTKKKSIVKKPIYHSVQLDFTEAEINLFEQTSKAIGCTIEFFIADAALWKAKGVIKRLQYEHNH